MDDRNMIQVFAAGIGGVVCSFLVFGLGDNGYIT